MLIKQLQTHNCSSSSQLFALFISNPNETVPFWYQRAASSSRDGVVVWDYHVVALEVLGEPGTGGGGALIWDLDLDHPDLGFPCTLQDYAQHALQSSSVELPEQFQRCACVLLLSPCLVGVGTSVLLAICLSVMM